MGRVETREMGKGIDRRRDSKGLKGGRERREHTEGRRNLAPHGHL